MMKKTTFIFLMLLAFTTLSTNAATIVLVEDSASCVAGTDADGDFLTGVADPDCAAFIIPTIVIITPIGTETSASCAAGTDADGDFLTGVSDPDCAAFATTTNVIVTPTGTETSASCAAGTDADGDFLTGVADPDCAAFATPATTTPPTPAVVGGGGVVGSSFGGGSSSGSSFGSGITSGTPVSSVITSTSTCNAFTTFMRKGRKNNAAEVTRLQAFLNQNLGLTIPTTGFFGNKTFDAVRTFQLKYKDAVLTPWGISYSTGYFYKTTQRQVNMLLCPGTEFPMPVLN